MNCIQCDSPIKVKDEYVEGYCQDCIKGKKMPVHTHQDWHRMVKRLKAEIVLLKACIVDLKSKIKGEK